MTSLIGQSARAATLIFAATFAILTLAACGGGSSSVVDRGPDTGTGDAGTGGAGTGDAGTGDAGAGDAGTGDAGAGDPNAGDPNTGDPMETSVGNRHFDTLGPWAERHYGGSSQLDSVTSIGLRIVGGYDQDGGPSLWTSASRGSSRSLASNPGLSGLVSARWSGDVIGVTHNHPRQNEDDSLFFPVSGNVSLSVDLTNYQGNLVFTNLEFWPNRTLLQGPGSTGAGTLLDGGTLSYTTSISERDSSVGFNYPRLVKTGGDEGTITGQFDRSLESGSDPHGGFKGTIVRSAGVNWTGVYGGLRE